MPARCDRRPQRRRNEAREAQVMDAPPPVDIPQHVYKAFTAWDTVASPEMRVSLMTRFYSEVLFRLFGSLLPILCAGRPLV